MQPTKARGIALWILVWAAVDVSLGETLNYHHWWVGFLIYMAAYAAAEWVSPGNWFRDWRTQRVRRGELVEELPWRFECPLCEGGTTFVASTTTQETMMRLREAHLEQAHRVTL